MALDYLTQNSLNVYPFKDYTTLIAENSSFAIPDDFFLDIIFVAKTKDVQGAYLSSYQNDVDNSQFKLQFVATPDNDAYDITVPYASVVVRGLITYADETVAIKIVPGEAFEAAKLSVDDSVYTFAAELAPSAVIRMVPRVTSISFFNWDNDTDAASVTPEATFSGDEENPIDDLTIVAGANVKFSSIGGSLAFDISRGAGTGLYDGCADELLTIKRINFVNPDASGNFLFEADDCYIISSLIAGINIENTCTPKCSTDQINAVAYYDNRVNDGISELSVYAESIFDTITAELTRYIEEVLPELNKPFYKIAESHVHAALPGKGYISLNVGLFNPSDAAVNYNFSTSGGVVAQFSQGGSSGSGTVPCLGRVENKFTLYGNTGSSVSVSGSVGGRTISYSTHI